MLPIIYDMAQFFLFSTQWQFFQILFYLPENWLTYQMNGADFKCEVENSVECHDVASLLPRQRCRRYVMIYSSYILINTRNGKPITHLL